MIRVILTFATALLNAVPELIKLIRDARLRAEAAKNQQAKDDRNDDAIAEAQKK